ncbi:hypothetical protein M0812_21071 [Anaeramoeba flamelloides]|uniref:Uncharacterized protein n=1 Tax=Anaeramoeba flamelloides TaxID=1746091 RepID=A0AAV7YT78_9EUKA|nr:hypothetical protein M0812_21071 [Anaeramoeba flamelloides]
MERKGKKQKKSRKEKEKEKGKIDEFDPEMNLENRIKLKNENKTAWNLYNILWKDMWEKNIFERETRNQNKNRPIPKSKNAWMERNQFRNNQNRK